MSSAMRVRFGFGALAGEREPCGMALRQRRRRLIGPHRIDRIGRRRPRAWRRRVCGGRAACRARRVRVQPRVVAELARRSGAFASIQPPTPSADQIARIEQFGVRLLAHLQRVAAVDEDRGLVGQHDSRTRGAGEGGEPGEPLGALGHIFALMLVGARHEEAVEAAPVSSAAEGGQSRRAQSLRRTGRQALEGGFCPWPDVSAPRGPLKHKRDPGPVAADIPARTGHAADKS